MVSQIIWQSTVPVWVGSGLKSPFRPFSLLLNSSQKKGAVHINSQPALFNTNGALLRCKSLSFTVNLAHEKCFPFQYSISQAFPTQELLTQLIIIYCTGCLPHCKRQFCLTRKLISRLPEVKEIYEKQCAVVYQQVTNQDIKRKQLAKNTKERESTKASYWSLQ